MRRLALRPVDVVVAVPANNEREHLPRCLRSVLASVDHARHRGEVGAVALTVVAHRCSDGSAEAARDLLRHTDDAYVLEDERPVAVGAVRDLAVRSGLARVTSQPEDTWVLSTDADTSVPRNWVSSILGIAGRAGTVAVVGVAELDAWHGAPEARQRYDAVLAAKYHSHDEHAHVYGANLAVRADAYLDVGGFPHHGHGEDQRLVEALAGAGFALSRTRAVQVVTSGRIRGRAVGGLAALLYDLQGTEVASSTMAGRGM